MVSFAAISTKLCPREHKPVNRDLEINPTTLKLEGDLDILKMYLHTENETASLTDSQLRA